MISVKAIKRWYWLHKWSSVICTLFLLFLAITGLPLIFHHELEPLVSDSKAPAVLPADAPRASFDTLIKSVLAQESTFKAVTYVGTTLGEPEVNWVSLNTTPDADPEAGKGVKVDARTAEILGTEKAWEGVIGFLLLLHTGMFAGIPGKLFLGFMTLLFLVSVVSGVVVYAPFMRRWSFGTVRTQHGQHARWIDYHKALGIITAVWALVVGGTGALNSLADLAIKMWQFQDMTAMVAESVAHDSEPDRIVSENMASVDEAIRTALQRAPDMELSFVAYPGTMFSSKKHYAVFLRGSTPVTARLIKPFLIDARDGSFFTSRDMPWYITALLISQPLHFGDYGGLPLKIIWALLDLAAIVVLVSGAWIWWIRRHQQPLIEEREIG